MTLAPDATEDGKRANLTLAIDTAKVDEKESVALLRSTHSLPSVDRILGHLTHLQPKYVDGKYVESKQHHVDLEQGIVFLIVRDLLAATNVKQQKALTKVVRAVLQSDDTATRKLASIYAANQDIKNKSAMKQIAGTLGMSMFKRRFAFHHFVKSVTRGLTSVTTSLDWTDFASNDQTTLVLGLVLEGKRSLPILWHTYRKSSLTGGGRTAAIKKLLVEMRSLIAATVPFCIIGDREFGNKTLYQFCATNNITYLLRMDRKRLIQDKTGQWKSGRTRCKGSKILCVTNGSVCKNNPYRVPLIFITKQPRMDEPWILVTNITSITGQEAIDLYARRWSTESNFRDAKCPEYGVGFGLKWYWGDEKHERRDSMWLIMSIATLCWTALARSGTMTKEVQTIDLKTPRKPTPPRGRGHKKVARKLPGKPWKQRKRSSTEVQIAYSLLTKGRLLAQRYFAQRRAPPRLLWENCLVIATHISQLSYRWIDRVMLLSCSAEFLYGSYC